MSVKRHKLHACVCDSSRTLSRCSCAEKTKDWISNLVRVIKVERSSNASQEFFVGVLLRHFSPIEMNVPPGVDVGAMGSPNISCMIASLVAMLIDTWSSKG